MEILDLLDNFSLKLFVKLYFLPSYVGAGHNGQALLLPYTEEVVGTSFTILH